MSDETAPVAIGELPDDATLVARLRAGDEPTFAALVARHHGPMVRVARAYVKSDDVAQEVVQEAWMGILKGLEKFEGRASLKTWMYRILTNRAKTRGKREGRTTPFSALGTDDATPVDADRFDTGGGWNSPPAAWARPDRARTDADIRRRLQQAIDALPERQRVVITLRDIEGLPSADVCNVLDITETNQRVLLHRARARVRAWLSDHLEGPS